MCPKKSRPDVKNSPPGGGQNFDIFRGTPKFPTGFFRGHRGPKSEKSIFLSFSGFFKKTQFFDIFLNSTPEAVGQGVGTRNGGPRPTPMPRAGFVKFC
jgi:hypothetical protein